LLGLTGGGSSVLLGANRASPEVAFCERAVRTRLEVSLERQSATFVREFNDDIGNPRLAGERMRAPPRVVRVESCSEVRGQAGVVARWIGFALRLAESWPSYGGHPSRKGDCLRGCGRRLRLKTMRRLACHPKLAQVQASEGWWTRREPDGTRSPHGCDVSTPSGASCSKRAEDDFRPTGLDAAGRLIVR